MEILNRDHLNIYQGKDVLYVKALEKRQLKNLFSKLERYMEINMIIVK